MLENLKIPKIKSRQKHRFILSIGDEGAILLSIVGETLQKRIFITSPTSQEFVDLLSSAPATPIYIFADVLDQAYTQQYFPPVSKMNVGKLVKRKLQKDFNNTDITQALPLGRDKAGRGDWSYLFISVHNAPPFSDWINAVAELPNRLVGVYLLPLEAQYYLHDIQRIVASELSSAGKKSKWQFIVSHNRIGGFRQIVFKDSTIMFTRIAQPIGGLSPDVIAGNIEQETLNTIEYIRRLGYTEGDGLDIFIIASQQVKQVMENNTLTASAVIRLTPHEIATKLNLQNAAEPNDRFGDVVMAMHFALRKKHMLKLHSAYTQKLEHLVFARYGIRAAAAGFGALLIIMSAYLFLSTLDLNNKISTLKTEKQAAEKKLEDINRFKGNLGENWEKVVTIAKLHKQLSGEGSYPLRFLSLFGEIKGFDIRIQDIEIAYAPEQKTDQQQAPMLTANLSIDFIHPPESSLDRMLEDIDTFTGDMKRKFQSYDVVFSGLPDEGNITMNMGNNGGDKITHLKVSIQGPKTQQENTTG